MSISALASSTAASLRIKSFNRRPVLPSRYGNAGPLLPAPVVFAGTAATARLCGVLSKAKELEPAACAPDDASATTGPVFASASAPSAPASTLHAANPAAAIIQRDLFVFISTSPSSPRSIHWQFLKLSTTIQISFHQLRTKESLN